MPMPEWMGHIDGCGLAALTFGVGLILAAVAALNWRQQTSDPTAADNRRAHDRDTADRAAEAAHRAQTGDPVVKELLTFLLAFLAGAGLACTPFVAALLLPPTYLRADRHRATLGGTR